MIAADDISSVLASAPPELMDAVQRGDAVKVRALLRRLPPVMLRALDDAMGVPVESFESFVQRVSPEFIMMRWLEPVIAALQDIVDGKITRLIIEAPPRHGKSFIVSEHLPAYYLMRFPWKWVGLASHSSSLALGFSRSARKNYLRAGGRLDPISRAVQRWQTLEGDGSGGMWARGFDSGITGEGSGLIVIDDPVKSRKAIRTPQSRRDLIETYREVLYTRREATAAEVAMATRWHKQDLTGQLIDAEDDALETAEGWVLISRPALARGPAFERKLPASIRVIPDTRAEGEALAPERGYTKEKLEKIRLVVGPSTWGSLFQQDPRPMDGAMFKWEQLRTVEAAHSSRAYRVRYWDLAKSEGANDKTAGAFVSYSPESPVPVIIEDIVSGQWGEARRDQKILQTAHADAARYGKHGFMIWFERLGKDNAKALVALLAGHGYIVQGESPNGQGSKPVRAGPLASHAQVGNVALLKGSWNDPFREQACAFPHQEEDDEVDAAAGAYNRALDMAVSDVGGEEEFDLV